MVPKDVLWFAFTSLCTRKAKTLIHNTSSRQLSHSLKQPFLCCGNHQTDASTHMTVCSFISLQAIVSSIHLYKHPNHHSLLPLVNRHNPQKVDHSLPPLPLLSSLPPISLISHSPFQPPDLRTQTKQSTVSSHNSNKKHGYHQHDVLRRLHPLLPRSEQCRLVACFLLPLVRYQGYKELAAETGG